ncbi:alanine racemase [Mariniluteicoccus flavus]
MIPDVATTSARIHLDRFVANVAAIRAHVGKAEVMVVVKADAYGHGMVPCARAARAAGVTWLGVATTGEALAMRESGDTGRLMAWLFGEDTDLAAPVAADVDLGLHRVDHVTRVAAAAATVGRRARVHLKIDTGLCRNGSSPEEWDDLCRAAAEAEEAGAIEVVGVWSHFASSDELELPHTDQQLAVFDAAYARARALGLNPPIRHIANSAAALQVPRAHYEMVRVGMAAYGVDPGDGIAARQGIALQPVMELRAQLVHVKRVPAGATVSYGGRWTAPEATTLGLVPLGYGDGIPRHASGVVDLAVGGRRVPQRGRVCMDQLVVELGPDATDAPGDEVCLFGAPGAPTAEEWAERCGTIGYEIVTRVGVRVPRVHVGAGIAAGEGEHT